MEGYNMRNTDDFKERFKRWKAGENYWEIRGYKKGKAQQFNPTGDALETTKTIVSTLRNAGWSDIDIAGVLGNAYVESRLDPFIEQASGAHHGLWQNSTQIRDAIKRLYGDYSLNSQLQYVIDWDNYDRKKLGDYAYMGNKYKRNTYKTAADSAKAFEAMYERSGGQSLQDRMSYANLAYNWLLDTMPAVKKSNPAPSMMVPGNYIFNGGTLPTLEVTYDTPRTLIERVDEQKRQNVLDNAIQWGSLPNPVEHFNSFWGENYPSRPTLNRPSWTVQ